MNRKGFSFAEMLVSLLIIGVVIAASTPVIIRSKITPPENIWHWSNDNTAIYFGPDPGQQVRSGLEDISSSLELVTDVNGRMVVAADIPSGKPLEKSIFDFYYHPGLIFFADNAFAIAAGTDPKSLFKGITYAGRIAVGDNNLAFGIGAMQPETQPSDVPERNIAIGHYSQNDIQEAYDNTSAGYDALRNLTTGNRNTAVGYEAGRKMMTGDDNVFVGYSAGYHYDSVNDTDSGIKGSKNTIIGSRAAEYYDDTAKNNIVIGYNGSGHRNFYNFSEIRHYDNIIIGSDNTDLSQVPSSGTSYGTYIPYTPLIEGLEAGAGDTSHAHYSYASAMNVNAKKFDIKTFDGSKSLFEFSTNSINDVAGASYDISGYSRNPLRYTGEHIAKYYLDGSTGKYTGLKFYVKKNSSGVPVEPEVVNLEVVSANGIPTINYNDKLKVSFPYYSGHIEPDIFVQDALMFQMGHKGYGGCSNAYYFVTVCDGKEVFTTLSSPGVNLKRQSGETTPDTDNYNMTSANGLNIYALNNDISFKSYQNDIIATDSGINIQSDNKSIYFKEGFAVNDSSSMTALKKQILLYANSNSAGIDSGTPFLVLGETLSSAPLSFYIKDSKGVVYVKKQVTLSGQKIVDLLRSLGRDIYYLKIACRNKYNIYCTVSSDARLKNIKGNNDAGLEKINKIRVVNYTLKDDSAKVPQVGVIAQELKKIFPNSVFKGKDGYYRIKLEEMFFALINSVKQLNSKVIDLSVKITGLEKRIELLEQENNELKTQNEEIETMIKNIEPKIVSLSNAKSKEVK